MGFEVNGRRLREARLYRMLTMSDIANKANVSKQMISKYEKGLATPGLEVFQKIVSVLKFPVDFFTENDKFQYLDEGTFYRSRLTATQVEKQPSETYKKSVAVLRDYFGRFIEFPRFHKNMVLSSDPSEAANELRNIWNLGDKPIENVMYLLESHGLIVSSINDQSRKVDAHGGYASINGRLYYTILLNINTHTFFKQQFSLAHELGHFVLHSSSIEPQELSGEEYRVMEKEADEFASSFLLPDTSFNKSLGSNKMDLNYYLQLKSKWFVSLSSMVYRARTLQILTAEEYLKLQKRISYHHWRKEEPFDSSVEISRPQALHQAFDLLESEKIIQPNILSSELGKIYGTPYPNEILADILDVPISSFYGDIVQLRKN